MPVLSVEAGRGKRRLPDYRSYAGKVWRALQEFSPLLELLDGFEDSADAIATDDRLGSPITDTPGAPGPNATAGATLKALSPDYVPAGYRLVPCEDLGPHWRRMDTIGTRVGREALPLYLSLILSRLPGLGIQYQGFRTVPTSHRTATPGLLFQEIDEQDKEILLSELVFPLSPVETFQGRAVRDQVMEEDGRFILAPEYARDFLERNMANLVSTFSLFETDKLSSYKIRRFNPPVKLKLDHGIDFFTVESCS